MSFYVHVYVFISSLVLLFHVLLSVILFSLSGLFVTDCLHINFSSCKIQMNISFSASYGTLIVFEFYSFI